MPKAKSIPVRSVGQCIYCGAKDRPLTEEHIVAAGLGGVFTLLEASCEICQTEVNEAVEQPCMQRMFRDIRYKRKVGGRRKSKRPTSLDAYLDRDDGAALPERLDTSSARWERAALPYKEHPSILVLPLFHPPGLLSGLTVEASSQIPETGLWSYISPREPANGDPKQAILVETQINNQLFKRLLAKTAHCAAVAEFGVDGFEPYLLDIVLGRDLACSSYYIGARPGLEPPIEGPFSFEVGVIEGDPFDSCIHVKVRFFADLDAPTYSVIAGKKL